MRGKLFSKLGCGISMVSSKQRGWRMRAWSPVTLLQPETIILLWIIKLGAEAEILITTNPVSLSCQNFWCQRISRNIWTFSLLKALKTWLVHLKLGRYSVKTFRKSFKLGEGPSILRALERPYSRGLLQILLKLPRKFIDTSRKNLPTWPRARPGKKPR